MQLYENVYVTCNAENQRVYGGQTNKNTNDEPSHSEVRIDFQAIICMLLLLSPRFVHAPTLKQKDGEHCQSHGGHDQSHGCCREGLAVRGDVHVVNLVAMKSLNDLLA